MMIHRRMSSPPREMDLSHYLASLERRAEVPDGPEVEDLNAILAIERAEELVAASVGVLILERCGEHGGTLVPLRVVRALRGRLLEALSAREVMSLEVEAYRVLSWLAQIRGDVAPPAPRVPPPPEGDQRVRYDADMPHIDLVRRAIAEDFDLEMTYYTQSRGQVTRRRITPLHLEAETYLHAYCHSRREERVFRISRIGEVKPVDGVTVELPAVAPAPKGGQGTLDI